MATFHGNLSYDLYDLTQLGDVKSSRNQYQSIEFNTTWALPRNPFNANKSYGQKGQDIIALSAYIKSDILIAPFNGKNNTICFWSLNNEGVRLASLPIVPGEAVVAISEDIKYAATVNRLYRDVKIYNLENGCLAYTLKSAFPFHLWPRATFCFNSRYLALSDVELVNVNHVIKKCIATFVVWYIEAEVSIFTANKNMGHILPRNLHQPFNLLKPFILEEVTNDNERVLKGFYPFKDQQGIITTQSFELKIDLQQSNAFRWIEQDAPPCINEENVSKDLDERFVLVGNYTEDEDQQGGMVQQPTSADNISRIQSNININDNQSGELLLSDDGSSQLTDSMDFSFDGKLNASLTSYLDGNRRHIDYEISNSINDFFSIKCGTFEILEKKYFVRCGKHMIQLWQLPKDFKYSDDGDLEKYRLVYIKPFTNSDYRSFYLSPNIWRIENYKSVKFIGEPSNARIILNIVEDERFSLNERENNSTTYTEEFILPITSTDKSFNFHVFEGACQALYYLSICPIDLNFESPIHYTVLEDRIFGALDDRRKRTLNIRERNANAVYQKTLDLIAVQIEKIDGSCTYFKTTAGSKLLAMLASFEEGRSVLKSLIKNEAVIFNLTNYSVDMKYFVGSINTTEISRYSSTRFIGRQQGTSEIPIGQVMYRSLPDEAIKKQLFDLANENVLTILIRERQYNLYHLMLNRILSDSTKAGPEFLSILNEALFLLQELRNNDYYEKSCLKLLYLPTGDINLKSSDLAAEIPNKADVGIEGDMIASIKDIYCLSTLEQLQKLRRKEFDQNSISYGIMVITNRLLDATISTYVKIESTLLVAVNFFKDTQTKPSDELVKCVVPITYFNTYYRTTVRDAFLNISKDSTKGGASSQLPYKSESAFILSALDQHSEPSIWKQGGDVMAIILQYKWRTFIRRRFYAICIIYLIYYISYCTGVQFAHETYNYDSTSAEGSITSNGQHLISIILFFLSGATLLYFEISQMRRSRRVILYFKNWYNLVDLAAIVFPLTNFLQLVLNWNNFYEVTSVCALILWLHGLIRLRVFSSVGIALETIIQLFQKVASVLCILLAVVVGFTHSFIALLRQRLDQYFQENYGGETSLSLDNNSAITGETTLYDLSSSNGFSDPFKALYHVWLFIFGVWDPVTTGDSGDNRMVFVLCMIFAFITVLIFTNMIIALMSSTVEEVKKRGKKVWITHFAAVIAEIEDLAFESTRHDRVNNPAFIFYLGNSEKVAKQKELLQEETRKLRKMLGIDDNDQ